MSIQKTFESAPVPSGRQRRKQAAGYLVLGASYWATASLGLLWAEVSGAGSPVWPAAGVAFAGLLLGGMHLWPAILVGRLLAAVAMGSQNAVWVDLFLATSNAFAAMVPAYVVSRYLQIHRPLTSLSDVLNLAVTNAMGATVSAVLGVGVLAVAHNLEAQNIVLLFENWWFGHMVGALVVSALILSFSSRMSFDLTPTQWAHLATLLVTTAFLSYFIFVDPDTERLRAWHIFPFLIWAALAFHVRGAALVLLTVLVCAIWGATNGAGPFADINELSDRVLLLAQEFLTIVSLTTLFLAGIADERRGKEALQKSETRLRQVLEGARAGYWEVQVEPDLAEFQADHPIDIDESYRDLYGFANNGTATVGKWRSRVHPDDLPLVDRELEKALRREHDQWEQSFRITHPERGERWIRDRVWVKRDADGRVISVGGLNVDATDQKCAEEALRDISERLELAVRAHGIGIFDCSLKTGTMILSQKQEQILGVQPGEFEGHCSDFFRRLAPEDAASLETKLSLAKEAHLDQFCFEFRVERADGTLRNIEGAGRILYDTHGQAERVIATSVDVSERKQAERALRESETRLQLAIEGADLGTWELDLTTDTVVRSLRHDQMLGYQELQPEWGLAIGERHVVEEDRAIVREALRQAEQSGTLHFEVRVRWPDGSVHWIETFGRTVNGDGKPRRMSGVVADVTERKRAEESIRLLMAEVNHRAKNILAIVQSIVLQTAGERNPKEFASSLNARLRGLAASNDLLVRSAWQAINIRDLLSAQLGPFVDLSGDRLSHTGPELKLNPIAAQTIGMALHELATNAVKYGALSNRTGHISIDWGVTPAPNGRVFRMEWREAGGPTVAPPQRRGFGTTVIVDAVEYSLGAGAGVDLEHSSSGVTWRVTAPLSAIVGQ